MIRGLAMSLVLAAASFGVSDALAQECNAQGSATALDAGHVRYSVVLPRGQRYVELFVRQNGIQNVASEITSFAADNGDGTATYSLSVGGYRQGDAIEYRFYSYLPSAPGVFSPGPIENAWLKTTFAAPALTFVGNDRAYTLGPAGDEDIEVYQVTKISDIHPVSVGWELLRADPSPFTTPLHGGNAANGSATMLGVYVKPCDGSTWINIASTPFALSSPSETSSGGQYSYSGFFNTSLPGTRVNPVYECGGHDITIPTFIGPQTLRTGASVTFAYVVEHRSHAQSP